MVDCRDSRQLGGGWVIGLHDHERQFAHRRKHDVSELDVRLFRNLRFSAASGSIAVAFFALFGFIFLITQYLQFVKGYTPLNTGVRLLPVAGSLAAASIIGTKLAVTIGNKGVIAGGLGLLGIVYVWISTVSAATTYPEIVAQMLLLGTGMGLTSTPATEAILGAVSKDKAGIGSATASVPPTSPPTGSPPPAHPATRPTTCWPWPAPASFKDSTPDVSSPQE